MTTSAIRPDVVPRSPHRDVAFPRLARAELLKLRRRRGLMAFAAVPTIVPMVIGYGVTLFLHATDAAHHGPAGGISNLAGSLNVLALLGGVAAILIGSTAGAGDLGAGVFRELVVTGRSRTALYAARIPAGLAVLFAFLTSAFAFAALASVMFAGSSRSPDPSLILASAGWVAVTAATSFAVALGVSSLLGSRSMSIGILLGWQLALANLLLAFSFLGVTREALLPAGVARLTPGRLDLGSQVTMSVAAAAAVILGWTIVALVAGGWRTVTRDA